MMLSDSMYKSELFSISTQLYVRFRRVSGRVVDAIYMTEDRAYAEYVANLAFSLQDNELHHYASKLIELMGSNPLVKLPMEEELEQEQMVIVDDHDEPREEDVYKAEVSHHYIGALR